MKMFLLDNGIVAIRNSAGIEVSFYTLDEFAKYVPWMDLSSKTYVDYEPDRGIFIDAKDMSINMNNAPYAPYEQLIAQVETLAAQKADPYFGMSLEEKAAAQKEEAIADLDAAREAALWAGFTCQVDGVDYPCDPVMQTTLLGYLSVYREGLKAPEDTTKVRRMDNTFSYLNQAQLVALAAAMLLHVQGIWDAYWSAKDAL